MVVIDEIIRRTKKIILLQSLSDLIRAVIPARRLPGRRNSQVADFFAFCLRVLLGVILKNR